VVTDDAWPVYREEDCTFVAFCDDGGFKCLAVDATHYLANDPNGSTRLFPLTVRVAARHYFTRGP